MGPCRSCWKGTISAMPPEEITSKGTSFMCVLLIKVPTRKKSGNLINDPRIYIYIYVYTLVLIIKKMTIFHLVQVRI